MLFNSFPFLFFFATVYSAYLASKQSVRTQNVLLLIASYVFYCYWDWRFLSLLLASTLVDYSIGRALHSRKKKSTRKRLLLVSVGFNLSLLGLFKYFNFFSESFADLMRAVGFAPDFATLNIILPLGISFYTFQTMSYTFDIYRGELKPTKNLLNFALFVSFFPQLVAGPIERARHLLPQIENKRKIKMADIDAGIFLVIWGLFKKVVIADNVAIVADTVFNSYFQYEGVDILIGVLAFTVQIYCDFSGYSDIARGLCKLMGFDLIVNFRLPYFALNPSDFWRRWHISLSTWLRDYLYVSLGGNRHGHWRTYRNLLLTMLLGGLWHGAAWTFVIWGLYHGLILCAYRMLNDLRSTPFSNNSMYALLSRTTRMSVMFIFTIVGWAIFRSQSVDQLVSMLTSFSFAYSEQSAKIAYQVLFFSIPLILTQLYQHRHRDLLAITKQNIFVRGAVYCFLLSGITIFGVRESLEFIYFQF